MKCPIWTLILVRAAVALAKSVLQRTLGLTAVSVQRQVLLVLIFLLAAHGGFGPSTSFLVAAPLITRQPADLVVAIGGDAQFTVTATGAAPLTYQWRCNDLDLKGASQRFLRINNAQPDCAGSYTVLVTDASGSTTSQPAVLAVDKEWVLYNPVNSGLPYKGVVDFEFDRNGDIWLATGRWYAREGGGLAGFNGRDWTVWRASSLGLPDNDCTGMTQDAAGNLWIATDSGLARFDRMNTWTVVLRSQVWYPKFDLEGNLWVGSGGGLLSYDGAKWTTYKRANTGLPSDFVTYITVDKDHRKWISTWGGLAIFDNTNWVTYTAANSGLPNDKLGRMAFDAAGTAWITTGGGLAHFDGTQWTKFDRSNSPIPSLNFWDLLIDPRGVKWIATEGGLARLEGTNWTVFTRSNSRLPDNFIYSIALDPRGNLWIGTQDGGAAVYREGGVILRLQLGPPIPDGQGHLLLRWSGGQARYQLQSRASLTTGEWENCGGPTDQQSATVNIDGSSRFFRVNDVQP
jgi:hypothetical protein